MHHHLPPFSPPPPAFTSPYFTIDPLAPPHLPQQPQHYSRDESPPRHDAQLVFPSLQRQPYTGLAQPSLDQQQPHTEGGTRSFQQERYAGDESGFFQLEQHTVDGAPMMFRLQHGADDGSRSLQMQDSGESMGRPSFRQQEMQEREVENEIVPGAEDERNPENENHRPLLPEQQAQCGSQEHETEDGNQTCSEEHTLNAKLRCLQKQIEDPNDKPSQRDLADREFGLDRSGKQGDVQRSKSPVHGDCFMGATLPQPISDTQRVYPSLISHVLEQSRSPDCDLNQPDQMMPRSQDSSVSHHNEFEQSIKRLEKSLSPLTSDIGRVKKESEGLVNADLQQPPYSHHQLLQDLAHESIAQQSNQTYDVEEVQDPRRSNGERNHDTENVAAKDLAPATEASIMGHEHFEHACSESRDGGVADCKDVVILESKGRDGTDGSVTDGKTIDILETEERRGGAGKDNGVSTSAIQLDDRMHVETAAPFDEVAMEMQPTRAPEFLLPDKKAHSSSSPELCYPPPSATHEAVVHDRDLFMATLGQFLTAFGKRLTVPKMGGKELDLHALYCEVTSRGGLEQVLRAAVWKDVSNALGLPSSLSNASFILRKYYSSFLFHYEQVYYFRAEGKLSIFPVPLPAPRLVESPAEFFGCPYEVPPEVASSLRKRKKKLNPLRFFGVDPAAAIGTVATGAITGKVDEGYLITMVVGSEKLSGILYHVPPGSNSQQYASVPKLADGNASGLGIQLCGKKRKKYVRKKDPNAPKRTRTGYNIFFKEQRARLKQLYPKSKGHGKTVIEMWNKLPDSEKALYVARGNEEREKYLEEFREKMRLQSLATPADDVDIEDTGTQELELDTYDVAQDYHVSLDVENNLQDGQQVENGDYNGFDVSEPQPRSTEMSSVQLIAERTTDVQEDEEADYADEPDSEEDSEAEMDEDVYEEAEDEEATCLQTEAFREVHSENQSQIDDLDYSTRKAVYPEHVQAVTARELGTHDPTASFSQDHNSLSYIPLSLQQQTSLKQAEVSGDASIQVPLSNNTMLQRHHDVITTHNRFSVTVSENNATTQTCSVNSDRLASQIFAEDTSHRSLLQEQELVSSSHKQEEGPVYMTSLHQNQASLGIHAQKLPLEEGFRDRFAYPLHFSYAHPTHDYQPHPAHDYQPEFPHFTYSVQMAAQAQNPFTHAYAPPLQHQVPAMDVQGVASGSSMLLKVKDVGCDYHNHDNNNGDIIQQ